MKITKNIRTAEKTVNPYINNIGIKLMIKPSQTYINCSFNERNEVVFKGYFKAEI